MRSRPEYQKSKSFQRHFEDVSSRLSIEELETSKLNDIINETFRIKEENRSLPLFTKLKVWSYIKLGLLPKYVWEFDGRFWDCDSIIPNTEGIERLCRRYMGPEDANPYPSGIDCWGITDLWINHVYAETANTYPSNFSSKDILAARNLDISGDMARASPNSSGEEIIRKHIEEKVPNDVLKRYDDRFSIEYKYRLFKEGILPEEANGYPEGWWSEDIITFHKLGLDKSKIRINDDELKGIIEIIGKKGLFENDEDKITGIATGYSGIVLIFNNRVIKISRSTTEADVIHNIMYYHEEKMHNTPLALFWERLSSRVCKSGQSCISNYIDIDVLELERIKGDSLERLVCKKGKLDEDHALRYGSHIINGLYEMRQAKVRYHRDIRPANILIDELKDRAMIIDFGLATAYKWASPMGNRRFGSAFYSNDLVSLGQVMYYMATGEHIFAESESMTRTFSDIADEIKDYRTEVYKHPERLQERIQIVKTNIKSEPIREIIEECLISGLEPVKLYDNNFDNIRGIFEKHHSRMEGILEKRVLDKYYKYLNHKESD